MKLKGWLDSRLVKPSCNHFDRYIVIYECDGFVNVGICGWMPTDHYTDGEWQMPETTNGARRTGARVLYWREWPEMLSVARKCRI